MTKRRWLAVAVLLPALAAGVWFYRGSRAGDRPSYRFASVERGDLEATVSATGALGAVTTVQVGTQVSGQVSEIHVDFNDRVRKGQLIARIDPTLQQQTVRDAQAGWERVQAELASARRADQRNLRLFEQGLIAQSELDAARDALAVARAGVKSAQVSLDRARQNLDYTSIYAPIDGIVVERNVDVGQTVAASLSAPQLFLIANDLARLQILAAVDESDIGQIRQGQPVRFTVQAYPDQRFTGTVRQVRLQSATTENVVNYTTVIEVENASGKLLPGMTATVDFLTGSAQDVLTVPNAALRFRPTEAMLAAAGRTPSAAGAGGGDRGARSTAGTGGVRDRRGAAASGEAGADTGNLGAAAGGRAANAAMLWTVDAERKFAAIRIRTGLSDGQRTEASGDGLAEGMQVIVGVTQGADAAAAGASPFPAPAQGGGPRRPGGF